MPEAKPYSQLAEATLKTYEQLQNREELSPRVKMALRMYAHGAVRTLEQAAEATGISYQYLSTVKNFPIGKKFMNAIDEKLSDKSIQTSAIISELGRKAIGKIAGIMEDGEKEEHRLKAAIDLADRAPETSKIQKHQVEAFTLSGKDALALATALTQSQQVREHYTSVAAGNYDKVGEIGNASLQETIDGISQCNGSTPDSERTDEVSKSGRLLGSEPG
jgi:hypothetical protein